MLRVLTFCNCVSIGQYRVNIIVLDVKGNEIREVDYFPDYNMAREHVSEKRLQWLLKTFDNFVQSMHILYNSSAGDHYVEPSRLKALSRLLNAINLLPSLPCIEVCKILIGAEPLMHSILPHRANSAYDSSLVGIYQMIHVCNEELDNKLSLFVFKPSQREIYL